jgi:hypothetical protein
MSRTRAKAKTIAIVLTLDEARALSDAAVDCAMEGFPLSDVAPNAAETWGERWRPLRTAAIVAADKLARRVKRASP